MAQNSYLRKRTTRRSSERSQTQNSQIMLSNVRTNEDQTSYVSIRSRRKSVLTYKKKSVLDKRTTYTTYTARDDQGQQKTMVTSYVQAYEKNVDI